MEGGFSPIFLEFTFPDGYDVEAHAREQLYVLFVALLISLNLIGPECLIRFGKSCAVAVVPMPKAAVDKYDCVPFP